ncbi:MAG: chemotaxis protein CheW [Parachlamydia sp.]|nr:chemotaxis protein CheW [Parachlamydia sp.]
MDEVISAKMLLDRKPDDSYIAEWTALLQQEAALEGEADELSVVVFRLAGEWLALSTAVFAEIAHTRLLHHIPHRSGFLLLGLLNLRGQLRLCVSLHKLLELEDIPQPKAQRRQYSRLIAIRKGEERWTFPVDEVFGAIRFKKGAIQNVPVTVAKSTANYLRGVMLWEGKSVGILDEELLFQSLRRSLI